MELIHSNSDDQHFKVSFLSESCGEQEKSCLPTSLLRQQLEELELRNGLCGSNGTSCTVTQSLDAFPLEILENILVRLDLLSLLRMRRTSTYFHEIITNRLPLVWLKQYEHLTSSISLLDKPAIIDGFENAPNSTPISHGGMMDLDTLPSAVNLNVGSTEYLISRASSGIDAATAMFLDRKGGRASLSRDLGCNSWQDLCKDLLSTVLQPVDIVTPHCSVWRVYAFQPGSRLIPLSSTSSSIVISEDELFPDLPFSLLFVVDSTIENPTHLLNGFYITSALVPEEEEKKEEEKQGSNASSTSTIPSGWPSYFTTMEVSSNSRFYSRGGGRQRSMSRGSMSSYVTGIFAERLLCGGAQTSSLQSMERFRVKDNRWCPTNNFCVRFWYTSSGDSSFDPPPVILNQLPSSSTCSSSASTTSASSSFLSSSPMTISPICTPSPISMSLATSSSTSSSSSSSSSSQGYSSKTTSPTSSGVMLGMGSGGSLISLGPSRMICRREIRSLYDGEKKKHFRFTSGMRVAFAVRASLDLGGGELIFGIKFK